MEDDSSIFELNITADRLLVPLAPQEAVRDVVAIIHAKVKMFAGQGICTTDRTLHFHEEN